MMYLEPIPYALDVTPDDAHQSQVILAQGLFQAAHLDHLKGFQRQIEEVKTGHSLGRGG